MKIGENDLEIEAPDLVVVRVRGELLAADTDALGKAFAETQREGSVFVLSLVETSNFVMSGDARRALVLGMRGVRVVYDAVVGADFHVRVISRFVEIAARILSGIQFQLGFFDDEASARAWLREHGCIAASASPPRGSNPPHS